MLCNFQDCTLVGCISESISTSTLKSDRPFRRKITWFNQRKRRVYIYIYSIYIYIPYIYIFHIYIFHIHIYSIYIYSVSSFVCDLSGGLHENHTLHLSFLFVLEDAEKKKYHWECPTDHSWRSLNPVLVRHGNSPDQNRWILW